MIRILLSFSLAILLSSCDDNNVSSNGLNGFVGADVAEEAVELSYRENNVSPSSKESQQTVEQKIIKTARLRFATQDTDATHAKVLKAVQQNNGFIQNDNSGKNYNEVYRNIVVRVPSENFMALLTVVSKGVAYFDERSISRQDVSEEFVDLEARLKAKRELEKRYLELLRQAKDVTEMLEIERELSTIREEIEAKQGRLQYLQDQVSVSTVNISFYKETAEKGITVSYGQKVKNALKGGWNAISSFFLALLYIWPFILILLLGIWLLRLFIKRREKNKK